MTCIKCPRFPTILFTRWVESRYTKKMLIPNRISHGTQIYSGSIHFFYVPWLNSSRKKNYGKSETLNAYYTIKISLIKFKVICIQTYTTFLFIYQDICFSITSPLIFLRAFKVWNQFYSLSPLTVFQNSNTHLVEWSTKEPPSRSLSLAKSTALTNGTAVSSSRSTSTENLYFFFFIMKAISLRPGHRTLNPVCV